MKSNAVNKDWLSIHLYHSSDADTLLKNLVTPFLKQLEDAINTTTDFFFVRYFDKGYHIRLRLSLDSQEKYSANCLLKKLVLDYNTEKDDVVSISYVPYIAEIDRYGNKNTIHLAEQQFGISSSVVLDWLNSCDRVTLSGRYLQALKLHIAFFKGISLDSDHALDICNQFIEGWLPQLFIDSIPLESQVKTLLSHFEIEYAKYKPILLQTIPEYWQQLGQTNELSSMRYLEIHKAVYSDYDHAGIKGQKINDILGSFIHMTNNRLGISNRDEAFVIYLVKKSLLILITHDDSK